MSEINKDIQTERIELGLSQLDAAYLLGVSRPTYIKWEQNVGDMPIGQYEKLLSEFKRIRELKEQE